MNAPQRYRLGYRPDIEGLRAIAVLAVVAAHAKIPGFAGGFVGVDVFFVLSGYLITALLVLEIESSGTIGMWAFYARRLRRLAPGLLVVLSASVLLIWLSYSPTQQLRQVDSAAAAALWLSNFHFAFTNFGYFDSGAESNLFLHTWSLGVEEQFYLLWPWLLLAAFGVWKRRGGGRDVPPIARVRQIMVLVFCVSLAACLFLMRSHPEQAFYMMPARAWQFSLGALVWIVLRDAAIRARFERAMPWLGWLGLALIVVSVISYSPNVSYPGLRALVPSLGAALVIGGGQCIEHSLCLRLLSLAPMQALGRVSYSWYLWHWPIMVWGSMVFVAPSLSGRLALALLSLLLAVLTFRCIELPIRRQDRLLYRPAFMVVGALAVSFVAGAFCLGWGERAMGEASSASEAELQKARQDLSILYGMDCDRWFYSAEVSVCIFGDKDAAHTAVLMGDSIGVQWFPALEKHFSRPGWKLLVITKSSCPMIDKSFFYARIGKIYTVCTDWRARALAYVADTHPDLVMLGSSLAYDFSTTDWAEGTRDLLQAIAPDVGTVILIRATPTLPFDGLECLASDNRFTRALAGDDRCSGRAANVTQGEAVQAALREGARPFANVGLLDMNDVVCPNGICAVARDGRIVYRDGQHLTASYVATLGKTIAGRIEALVDEITRRNERRRP
jgi:peptidoglycan/LPS O-acetylase OafA/YrhL